MGHGAVLGFGLMMMHAWDGRGLVLVVYETALAFRRVGVRVLRQHTYHLVTIDTIPRIDERGGREYSLEY